MSTEAPTVPPQVPVVLARADVGAPEIAGFVAAAVDAGATMVELSLADLEGLGIPAGADAPGPVGWVVTVADDAEAARALECGAVALRVEVGGDAREPIIATAAEHGAAVHVPFGRGAPVGAALDVGTLDPDAGDDLVGRLAALTDLAAAGRTVIASIGPIGADATATLAALATSRGASILRVHEVEAAVRSAAVLATIRTAHAGRPR